MLVSSFYSKVAITCFIARQDTCQNIIGSTEIYAASKTSKRFLQKNQYQSYFSIISNTKIFICTMFYILYVTDIFELQNRSNSKMSLETRYFILVQNYQFHHLLIQTNHFIDFKTCDDGAKNTGWLLQKYSLILIKQHGR